MEEERGEASKGSVALLAYQNASTESTGQVTTATLCIFRLAGFRGGVAPGYCTHAGITHDTMSILLFAMLVMLAIMLQLCSLQPARCTY